MMCFRITPLAWYPRSADDAAALVEQYANFFATLSGPWRFLSFTRTFSYQRQRQGLNRRAAMLAAQGEPSSGACAGPSTIGACMTPWSSSNRC